MLKVLKNPVTSNYVDLKQFILSNDFVWRYDTSTGMPFYGHTFLERPEETGFSQPLSELVNLNLTVLKEIIDFNNLFDRYFFLRSNVNCVHPDNDKQFSEPHFDHDFPHFNLLVYLCGDGETIVENENYFPDDNNISNLTKNLFSLKINEFYGKILCQNRNICIKKLYIWISRLI